MRRTQRWLRPQPAQEPALEITGVMGTMTHTLSSRIAGTAWAWLALAALSQDAGRAPGLVAEYFAFGESLRNYRSEFWSNDHA